MIAAPASKHNASYSHNNLEICSLYRFWGIYFSLHRYIVVGLVGLALGLVSGLALNKYRYEYDTLN